ncbi:hypothetical protein K9U39_08480 [Rhodoblastus acidophilus]|uniref:UBA domain-containing protein n=1 Tax=Candidatus Rhodoblastus alkanivorans TaxID=2954117 RepID=A0ABS9Z7L0_9HYPH|nr:hypothetical protein [Candidatus Rhodoblastus alkanivorans]MCI4679628.1 hypothetical protein [Candidatus Rhodoblastus alkanivorans]MCI4683664.1 hypothetical protein [Candidatus Rhodoblastus alkanivorans]MDI4640981.1 hypothetical protein [Rhodoblastus acidophilus]
MTDWISRNFVAAAAALYAFLALTGAAMLARFYSLHVWSIHRLLGFVAVPVTLALAWRYRRALRAEAGRIVLFVALFAAVGLGARLLRRPQPASPPIDSTNAVIHALATTPLADLAPIYRSDPQSLVARLRELGFSVAGPRQSLSQIARASGRDDREALGALTEFLRGGR